MAIAGKSSLAGLCLTFLPVCSSQTVKDLTEKSLEELLNVRVTSASRKPQSLRTTAAAAFVITFDDIRRSGLYTLPEVLRLATGVQWHGSKPVSGRSASEDLTTISQISCYVLVDGRSRPADATGTHRFLGCLGVLQRASAQAMNIPAFLRGDLRLGWRPREHVELSSGVQNAFDPEHYEFESRRLQALLSVPRNVYGALTWRF